MDEQTGRLVKQLKLEEGVKPKIYLDTKGIPTAGVGRNMRDVGLRPDEIDLMLANDIADHRTFLAKYPWYSSQSPVRQNALIDMSFMGAERLLEFVSMIHYLTVGEFDQAADEAVASKWYKDVGETRGNRVAGMLRTGAWPADIPYP